MSGQDILGQDEIDALMKQALQGAGSVTSFAEDIPVQGQLSGSA